VIAVGEATRQDNGGIRVGRERVGVPEDVDLAAADGLELARSLPFAVGARKLHHGDTVRASHYRL